MPITVQVRIKNGLHVAVDVSVALEISPHPTSQPLSYDYLLSLRRNGYLPSFRLHADAPGNHPRDIDPGVIGQIEMLVHGVVMLLWRLA
jgi:hypothetical protein